MSGFIDIGSFIIQAINITVIITVLTKFVFKPYLAYIDTEISKREELEVRLHSSEVLVKEAEEKAKDILQDAKNHAKEVREEARMLAKQEASLVTFEANKEADAIRTKALSEIDSERKAMENGLKDRILSIAMKLNAKLFADSKANEALLEKFSKDL